ncbi:MAG: polysaccharide deacetylase family protein [Acidobacteriota bacterium]
MKKILFLLVYYSGLARLFAWLHRKQVLILCYHGVTKRESRGDNDAFGLHIRQDRFCAQIEYLLRNYRVISLKDYLIARRENRSLPDYSVVLTFDDGFRNFKTVAAPLLCEKNIPVSIFLITDRIRQNNDLSLPTNWVSEDDNEYLFWEDVRQLSNEKTIQFGSHTCSHRNLATLSLEEVDAELLDSRSMLNTYIPQPEMMFAYPYGGYSEEIAKRAHTAKYACALTADDGFNDETTDLYKLRRALIGDDDDLPNFAVRISGFACRMRSLRNLFLGRHPR